MKGRRRNQRSTLIALACAGLLGFNFPLLMVWDQGYQILGLPMLPVLLFVIWVALIVLLALVSEKGTAPPPSGQPPADELQDRP